MWRRVELVWTDVSEERIASIFRVEKSASEEPAWAGGILQSSCGFSHSQNGSRMTLSKPLLLTIHNLYIYDLCGWHSIVK
jgi:hypothetical protein